MLYSMKPLFIVVYLGTLVASLFIYRVIIALCYNITFVAVSRLPVSSVGAHIVLPSQYKVGTWYRSGISFTLTRGQVAI